MREFFPIAIFKIKADIRMNKTTLNSQKDKHSMLSLRRATHLLCNFVTIILTISIHALLAESEAKVHKTVEHFCAYETNFMGIASSC